MLVKDEQTQVRHQHLTAQEAEADRILAKIKKLRETAALLENPDTDPTNPERQLGRSLPHTEIETRLTRLNPNLVFTPHPKNPTKRLIYLKQPTGELSYLFVCEAGNVPENSIMTVRQHDELTTEALRPGWRVDKADIPKHETIPHEITDDGEVKRVGSVVFDRGALLPGRQRLESAHNELVRGYRTVLLRLILGGIITETGAEREFGSQDRSSWAAGLGRRVKQTPW